MAIDVDSTSGDDRSSWWLAVAALVSLGLAWFSASVGAGAESDGEIPVVAFALLMPAPMVVSVLWGAAAVRCRQPRMVWIAAAIWLVAGLVLVRGTTVWQFAGNIAAGVVAGRALAGRWRIDLAIGLVAAVLLPVMIWAVVVMPVEEQLDLARDQMMEILATNIPAGADEAQRAHALEEDSVRLEQVLRFAVRLYPYVVGLGVLGEAALILVVVWWAVRRLGVAPPWTGWPPFSRWRLPFYLVWVLAAGVGLMLTRAPYVATSGLTLAMLAVTLLSIQGLAVQFFVTGRMLPPVARVVYWLFMGTFFVLLVLASGALLGLIDQWWDLRRLDAPEDGETGGDSARQ